MAVEFLVALLPFFADDPFLPLPLLLVSLLLLLLPSLIRLLLSCSEKASSSSRPRPRSTTSLWLSSLASELLCRPAALPMGDEAVEERGGTMVCGVRGD